MKSCADAIPDLVAFGSSLFARLATGSAEVPGEKIRIRRFVGTR